MSVSYEYEIYLGSVSVLYADAVNLDRICSGREQNECQDIVSDNIGSGIAPIIDPFFAIS